jgi:hypothetical protein
LATSKIAEYKPAVLNSSYVIEANPSDSNQLVVRSRRPQIIFDRMPWKAYDAMFLTGQYNRNIEWDGSACSDGRRNIFLSYNEAYLRLNMNSKGEELDQLHVSFWLQVRSEHGVLPDS